MRAEIISVGTELLLGQIVDTNSVVLAGVLAECGVSVYRRVTVGDNHERLLAAFKEALASNDIVIAIGGLGPTQDDITRETLAEAMGDELVEDEEIARRLKAFFRARKARFTKNNLRQALVPTRGRAIPNPNGTAPGLLFESGGKYAIALPGPPNEFIPMVQNHVVPFITERTGGKGTIRSRTLRICGMGESLVEDNLIDLMSGQNPTVAPYAKMGEVHVRVTARADDPDAAYRIMKERVEEIAERLGDHVYGFDDEPLEYAVVRLLEARQLTVATAESCTGGLLASRITGVPGSSRVFPGGVVNYSNESKTDLVYVPDELIREHGAVSEEVADALARGAIRRFDSDYGVGITGVAGPDGGTFDKPVGLVYIAVADDDSVKVDRTQFIGSRIDIRNRSAQHALVMLRNRILGRKERGGIRSKG